MFDLLNKNDIGTQSELEIKESQRRSQNNDKLLEIFINKLTFDVKNMN